jgi:RNA polymerase sigma-70 factor (ECF subfamily)
VYSTALTGGLVVDTADFDAFYRDTRQRVLGCVYLLTGDMGEAQDSVQEAYMRAWLRWSSVGRYDEPEAWVRLVAGRIATSRWRRARTRMRAYVRHGVDERVSGPDADAVDLVEALRRLPEDQREALVLHYLVGLPVADIARQTGRPEGTIKSRLARGRQALAGVLALDPSTEGHHDR